MLILCTTDSVVFGPTWCWYPRAISAQSLRALFCFINQDIVYAGCLLDAKCNLERLETYKNCENKTIFLVLLASDNS